MRTIVTHFSPDFDAITSCWLIKRYLPGWSRANLQFVPAGETINLQSPDKDPNIIHVDTGLGKFDHHQLDSTTSATKLVFDYLQKNRYLHQDDVIALERIVALVTLVDNFHEVFFPEPSADIYELTLYQLIDGLKNILEGDQQLIEFIFISLDALKITFKNKVRAEKEINHGFVFTSKWGKTLAMENNNEESLKLAQKKGYNLVIRKSSQTGIVRIKARPDTKYGLDRLYQKLIKINPQATWYLHISKKMLLNGSMKNPKTKPTSLSLKQIIELIKKI